MLLPPERFWSIDTPAPQPERDTHMSTLISEAQFSSAQNRWKRTLRRASQILLSTFTVGFAIAGPVSQAVASAPTGYQQTNLISNGAVDALVIDKNFIDPWGVSIGSDLWINANVTGLNYVTGPTGPIAFTVSIPPASGKGIGSPTGTVFTGSLPTGSFALPDKSSPFFLFCTLDGTVSGWSGGNVEITVNNSKANAVYNDMALLNSSKGTFLLLANFGAGADVEAYDVNYKRVMTTGFKDPSVPATYAPYAVHVINGTVYVTYTPRTVPGYQEILGSGHGFVDAFDETGKFLKRVIPIGDWLNAPWGMALAPATFGEFANDLLVGNFGDGTISAYDPKAFTFKGQVKDDNGNLIANPGLWEIFFGQVNPAVGDPNTLYFTAGLDHETAGLFGAITVANTTSTKTTTTLVSDSNPGIKGGNVTFTANVQPVKGTGEPEGLVTFTVDGKVLLTEHLDSTAHAVASSSALTVGKHAVAVFYGGDENFGGSSSSLIETVNLPSAGAPTFSPAVGTYSKAQTVSLSSSTKGATIYFTTDLSTPTVKSTVYSKPILVSKTTTFKAFAAESGFTNSAISTGTFTINLGATPAPTFTPAPGKFTATQPVTIADSNKAAVIYYTIDGTTPSTKSLIYSKAIAVSKTTTVKALAVASGLTPSAVVSATYTITAASPTATPTFSMAGGTYTATIWPTLSDATSGAVIYYTLDGSTPTTKSAVYSSELTISATTTVKAIAIAPGWAPSTVASAKYTISSGGGW